MDIIQTTDARNIRIQVKNYLTYRQHFGDETSATQHSPEREFAFAEKPELHEFNRAKAYANFIKSNLELIIDKGLRFPEARHN